MVFSIDIQKFNAHPDARLHNSHYARVPQSALCATWSAGHGCQPAAVCWCTQNSAHGQVRSNSVAGGSAFQINEFHIRAKGWRMEYRRSRTCITRDPLLLLCSSMEMMFFTGLNSVRPEIGSLANTLSLPEKRCGQPVLAKEFAKEVTIVPPAHPPVLRTAALP